MIDQNPFNFNERAQRTCRKYVVAFALVVIGIVLTFCGREPAMAFQFPRSAMKPIEQPWQIVDRQVCAGRLGVLLVVQTTFSKAGMEGPLVFTTIKRNGLMPILAVTKRGAGFVFQTRWRKPLGFCLHSFRSVQRKSGESQ